MLAIIDDLPPIECPTNTALFGIRRDVVKEVNDVRGLVFKSEFGMVYSLNSIRICQIKDSWIRSYLFEFMPGSIKAMTEYRNSSYVWAKRLIESI